MNKTLRISMCLALLPALLLIVGCRTGDWRTADRSSAGIAPNPSDTPEAVVQIYAARAARWRGYFAVHCWISVKQEMAQEYTRYEVSGWRLRWIRPV